MAKTWSNSKNSRIMLFKLLFIKFFEQDSIFYLFLTLNFILFSSWDFYLVPDDFDKGD